VKGGGEGGIIHPQAEFSMRIMAVAWVHTIHVLHNLHTVRTHGISSY
jgi:hypothetical protein